MPVFAPPLADHLYTLYDLLDFETHAQLPGFGHCTRDVIGAVLEQSARFSSEVLYPLHRSADEEGVHFDSGVVTTPKGFKEAYRRLVDGGWPALTASPEHGGQGMPHMVNVLFEEMINGANLSFGLFPGLTRGAYVALAQHGSAEQKALYAPKLASGEWAGSMCLTEAHCGTDLGLLRTMAAPNGDGSHALTGTKIFISAGEHDLTENIIYLVLARMPDAPKGTKGISLFLVPKVLVKDDGSLGARNAVACGSVEHKMGIHGCPTCVMNFDGATGWLVGEPHQGLKAMFAMMNTERIAVGIHGLAIAEASYRNAAAYARERLQGRAPGGARDAGEPADPIIVHPDVRRMLMTQRALTEGCRMLALWTAQALDVSERHGDAAVRKQAGDMVALMTPVVKAFLTDSGVEVANIGMQVLGGHGFIRANGQEQYARDVRITPIYEGANGIQAMDLLGRKVLHLDLFGSFATPVEAFVGRHEGNDALAEFVEPLAASFDLLEDATRVIRERAGTHPEEVGAAAVDYTRLLALTAVAYLFARAADVSLPRSNAGFHRAKLATARFFMQRVLPDSAALHAKILAGAGPAMEMDEAMF
ncbi:MAG: acyl-CoA dehydrogenase C-terminal domain-containing protein [Aestuariivirga sp.]|uniref:acyl-CoA dehydrogenase C-terminal domain-containing protein n=1 Tax=Aestuariivirga sp. TaxID=2650926 RepID=UPI0025B7AE34|nr:acyl-CoA dehydrogenase C-terminal domain-containing protein [Aestuariivirga sp.]MCA3561155.1 acyl-CoA dehydrogenase C-terminal domain-containing protein [Aestuariivirga sp.]